MSDLDRGLGPLCAAATWDKGKALAATMTRGPSSGVMSEPSRLLEALKFSKWSIILSKELTDSAKTPKFVYS